MTVSEEIVTLLTNKLTYLQSLKDRAIQIGDLVQIAEVDNKILEVTTLLQQLA